MTLHPSMPLNDPPDYSSLWRFFLEVSADRFALIHVHADTLRLTMNTQANHNPGNQHSPAQGSDQPLGALRVVELLAEIERVRLMVMKQLGFTSIQQDQRR